MTPTQPCTCPKCQPTPRRMKANPAAFRYHAIEHEETPSCKDKPACLPVDAPEPRICACIYGNRMKMMGERGYCTECLKPLYAESTPPPASAPGTPVEQKIRSGAFQGAMLSKEECAELCALLDEKERFERGKLLPKIEEQRRRAEKSEAGHAACVNVRDNLIRERDRLKADLAAARGHAKDGWAEVVKLREREAKLREFIAAVRLAISEKHDLCKAFDAALAATKED